MKLVLVHLTTILMLALSFTAQSQTRAQNPYQAEQERQAQQAIREGRFPELKDLTSTAGVTRACMAYHGADITLCGNVAAVYQKQRFAESAAQRQQESDARTSAVDAARENIASDAERAAYDACINKPYRRGMPGPDPSNCATEAHTVVEERQKKAEAAARAQAENEARIAREQAERARREQERKVAEEKLSACVTQNHQQVALHDVSRDIVETMDAIRASQKTIQMDKDSAAVSGVANLTARKQAGDLIVFLRSGLPSRFANYKSAGGTASSPEQVTETTDPCAALRLRED